jgi:hypothetical protein
MDIVPGVVRTMFGRTMIRPRLGRWSGCLLYVVIARMHSQLRSPRLWYGKCRERC